MTFQNPWAWLGLAALMVPILVHLLARRPATRVAFPTLRFLPATRLTPIRRGRLTDIGLLLIRGAVIAAAVAALSQPIWRRPSSPSEEAHIARAILVDATWSMLRPALRGGTVADAARNEAGTLRASATAARVVETARPASALTSAANWLAGQPMRRELVLISDFQTGTIDSSDLAALDATIGVRLIRVEASGASASARPSTESPPAVTLIASSAAQEQAEMARRAAEARGAPSRGRPDRSVAIVFPDAERRSDLLAAARAPDQPWMLEIVTRVLRDEQSQLFSDGLTWSAGAKGTSELRFFTTAPAGSLASAALIAAAARAASPNPSPAELTSATIDDGTLKSWERPAADNQASPVADPGQFDGRWLWLAALGFLVIESIVRRSRREPTALEVPHDQAA